MNVLAIVLFFIAAFHFCLYYCNMDVFTWAKGRNIESGSELESGSESLKDKESESKSEKDKDFLALSESKEILEKHLKELKQYNTHG